MQAMTVVQGMVNSSRAAAFERDYAELARRPPAPGLVGSQLLRKPDGIHFVYRIETLWESREALDRARSRPVPPESVRAFLAVGDPPSLEIFDLVLDTGARQDCPGQDGG